MRFPSIRIPLAVKIAASVVLFALVLSRIDAAALGGVLSRTDPALFLIAVGISFAAYAVNTYKWQVLLAGAGSRVPFGLLVRLNFIGMFYNIVLPGQVGGEVMKGLRLARSGVGASTSAVSVIADRVTGLLALLLLGVVGALLSPSVGGMRSDLLLWLVGLCFMLAVATVVLVTGRGIAPVARLGRALHLPSNPVSVRISKLVNELSPGSRSVSSLWVPLLISVVFQATSVWGNLLLCRALDIPVSYLQLLWVVAIVSLLQSLPISFAGIGVREGAFVYLLSLQGVSTSSALALSLLVFATQILLALAGGLVQLHMTLRGQ